MMWGSAVSVFGFFVGSAVLEFIRIPESLRGWIPVGVFFLVMGLMVFATAYWRCPVCGHYFTRGSEGKYCRNCDTSFED